MADDKKKFVLYDKDGKKVETTSRREATTLRFGHGYTTKPPKGAAPKKDAAPQKSTAQAPKKGNGGRK